MGALRTESLWTCCCLFVWREWLSWRRENW